MQNALTLLRNRVKTSSENVKHYSSTVKALLEKSEANKMTRALLVDKIKEAKGFLRTGVIGHTASKAAKDLNKLRVALYSLEDDYQYIKYQIADHTGQLINQRKIIRETWVSIENIEATIVKTA